MHLLPSLEKIGCKVVIKLQYKRKGYWRVGGPLELWAEVQGVSNILDIVKWECPLSILGNGSNMLMADEGAKGLSLSLGGDFLDYSLEPNLLLVVGAGIRNTVLLNRIKKLGYGGLASLAGVPGTIGGAVRMNAGTALGEIGSVVKFVEWVDRFTGTIHKTSQEDCQFGYRKSEGLPWSAIITRVGLQLHKADLSTENESVRHHLKRRKETQPLNLPSCGSVFTNPKGDYAGRLIELVGLKGIKKGGAQISDKHANFIVNNGNATAMDVYSLIKIAKTRVFEETGISLNPEVKPMGDWPEGLWPLA